MQKALLIFVAGAIAIFAALSSHGRDLTKEQLKELKNGEIIVKYREKLEGTDLRIVEATGVIDAPPDRVWKVIGDYENYKDFMPQVCESEVRKKEGNATWQYQKLHVPWPFPGDGTWYLIRLEHHPEKYFVQWEMEDGNIKINHGSWKLEPFGEKGDKTLAIYSLVVDPGYKLPAFVVDFATKTTVPNIIEAVRKRVPHPKYD